MDSSRSPNDFRAAAKSRLPRSVRTYIDGRVANDEHTLRRNVSDLADVGCGKRGCLKNVEGVESRDIRCLARTLSMPVALRPLGLTGMFARPR